MCANNVTLLRLLRSRSEGRNGQEGQDETGRTKQIAMRITLMY